MIYFGPRIVAHRGLHDKLPENSLAAMCAAWDAHIDWCECDVHLSSDGVPVVIHDDTLDRTTNGIGNVADYLATELQQLRLKDAAGNVTDHRLPLLDELLEKCGPARYLLVETKPLLGNRIIPLAVKVRLKDGMLQSFHQGDMDLVLREEAIDCPAAILVHNCEGNLARNFPS